MRVYEFSKQSGISSKELLDLLSKAGFSVNSHMSVLSPAAIEFLNKRSKKQEAHSSEAPVKETKKISHPVEANKEPMEIALTKKQATTKEHKQVNKAPASKIKEPVITHMQKQAPVVRSTTPSTPVTLILAPTTVAEIATATQKPASEIIVTLLKWGILSNKNQMLPVEVVSRLAEHYQIKTEKPVQKKEEIKRASSTQGESAQERLPVVVVVGHVDHGKTTLLDFIRNTRVATREKGGITQHIGAYEAKTKQGSLIFLDTPGHEAFSKMRARGVRVADIAVLVVAADDSVMPQTLEAIKHVKEIGLPIVVAVNKIDKVDISRVDIVKRDLSNHGLMPEEWGGDVIYAPISAKNGTGVDHLLEMIVLQSQLMELRADAIGQGAGYVLESRLEKGRGVVATLLLQQGKIAIGDYFSCGATTGKVSSLTDSYGKRLQEVGPSIPVQVAGFDELPEAGDYLEVLSKEDIRKVKSGGLQNRKTLTYRKLLTEGAKNIIVKTDTNSSKEALVESILKVSDKSEKGFNIIQASIGAISESDVVLAADTGSDIFTLHVKAEPNANLLAQRLGVSIKTFDVIYKLLEDLEQVAESRKEVKMTRKCIGEAVVRKVFDIKNVGVIAGCYVKDGIITKDSLLVMYRGKQKVGEGKITSLQREKRTVKEIHSGFECGIVVENFTEWQVDDRIEAFTLVPAK